MTTKAIYQAGRWLWPEPRTLADDMRDNPRPVDATPHVHYHRHGGSFHAHDHVHPESHAHSSRTDMLAHEERT